MASNFDSLERLVPDGVQPGTLGAETLRLHVARYEFAASFLKPGRVLDIACGAGYGTQLLARRGQGSVEAAGVDISPVAIDYAKRRYSDARTSFVVADAMAYRADPFDTIVSLETLEHLAEPAGFFSGLLLLLKPGGTLVASVPTTLSTDANPHHLHDFSEASLRRLGADNGLVEISCLRQRQPFRPVSLLLRREARSKDLRANLPSYYLRHPTMFLCRAWSTARHGFANSYLTVAWRRA